MTRKKIILFGSTGTLGQYIHNYFSSQGISVSVVNRSKEFDASNTSLLMLKSILRSFGADHNTIVINGIAVTPYTQQFDTPTCNCYMVNTIFPMLLSKACRFFCSYLVHPTTDSVFSGRHGHYSEDTLHDDTSDYGLSKSLSENIYATVIRTSLIGEHTKGISLVEWVKSHAGHELTGYTNHYWNGMTCLQFAKIIHQMMENDDFWVGIKHLASPQTVSNYDLIGLINKHYNLQVQLHPIKAESLCDMTLVSKYESQFDTPDISVQIQEMQEFDMAFNS